MSTFGILIKTHLPDLRYAERLLASLARHNVEGIPVYVVVSDADHASFAHVERAGVTLLRESLFASHLTTADVAGYSAGYINQEIVKLAFWEAGLVDNYLCLDSDAEMIRDFTTADFMYDEDTPYTFLTEDRDLQAEPAYYAEHWVVREQRLRLIQAEVGLASDRLLTVHGHAVFSATVLAAFVDRFLQPRGWDYVDALAIAPYEPSWYNFWLQKDLSIPIIAREPLIKTFHDSAQYLSYVLRGLGTEDAARGYVGIVLNSNYSRGDGLLSLDEPVSTVLSRYESGQTILRAMLARAASGGRRAPNRQ